MEEERLLIKLYKIIIKQDKDLAIINDHENMCKIWCPSKYDILVKSNMDIDVINTCQI